MTDRIHSISVDGIESRRPGGLHVGQQFVRQMFQLILEDYSESTKASYHYDPKKVYCDTCWLGARAAEHNEATHRIAARVLEAIHG